MKQFKLGGITAAGVLVMAIGAGAVGGVMASAHSTAPAASTTLHQVSADTAATPTPVPAAADEGVVDPKAAAGDPNPAPVISNSKPDLAVAGSSAESASAAADRAAAEAQRAKLAADRASNAADVATAPKPADPTPEPKAVATPEPTPRVTPAPPPQSQTDDHGCPKGDNEWSRDGGCGKTAPIPPPMCPDGKTLASHGCPLTPVAGTPDGQGVSPPAGS